MACNGRKRGSFHLFMHPKWYRIIFGKTHFGSIFDSFLVKNSLSRHFGVLEWPKWPAMGSNWAHFTCLCTPNGLGSVLEKHIFDPFWTHFWSQNTPFSRHFGILGGPQRATTSSKRAKNTCFGIPCGPGSFLKKVIFLHPVDLVDPFGTHLFGLPLAACRSPLGLGTGV